MTVLVPILLPVPSPVPVIKLAHDVTDVTRQHTFSLSCFISCFSFSASPAVSLLRESDDVCDIVFCISSFMNCGRLSGGHRE